MLTANQTKELSKENFLNSMESMEKIINGMIERGKLSITIDVLITDTIIKELQTLGYQITTDSTTGKTTISCI